MYVYLYVYLYVYMYLYLYMYMYMYMYLHVYMYMHMYKFNMKMYMCTCYCACTSLGGCQLVTDKRKILQDTNIPTQLVSDLRSLTGIHTNSLVYSRTIMRI